MNIYRLEHKECELYTALKARIELEEEGDKFNRKLIKENVPYEYQTVSAYKEHFAASVITYRGFYFSNPDEVNRKIWRVEDGCFVPNKRTKDGKEMAKILSQQKSFNFLTLMTMLGINNQYGSFKIPQLFYHHDIILIATDDNHRLTDSNLIEITRGELNNWLDKINKKE